MALIPDTFLTVTQENNSSLCWEIPSKKQKLQLVLHNNSGISWSAVENQDKHVTAWPQIQALGYLMEIHTDDARLEIVLKKGMKPLPESTPTLIVIPVTGPTEGHEACDCSTS